MTSVRLAAMIAAAWAATGCGAEGPTAPDAARIPGVVIQGITYSPMGSLDTNARPVGAAYALVLRLVDCSRGVWLDDDTHVEDLCPLKEGESDFLPAGTILYRIQGVEPAERLAVYRVYEVTPPIDPAWIELRALRASTKKCVPGPGNLCTPS